MTTNLSDDLREALDNAAGGPFRLVDSKTNVSYVIMRADEYEKLKQMVEYDAREFDPSEAYAFVDEVMKDDDAHDPALESYQSVSKQEK
jgi:hypothetical protein